jgi:hypothetical protein
MNFPQPFYDLALIHGYILVVSQEYWNVGDPRASRITVSKIVSLADHWSPINAMDQWKSVALKDIPVLVSSKIESRPYYCQFQMSAHASPICEDIYAIWVGIPIQDVPESAGLCVYKYTLSCPTNTSLELPKLSLQSIVSAPRPYSIDLFDISYAGHLALFDPRGYRTQRVLALRELDGLTKEADATYGNFDLRESGERIHISAYSGAVTYCTQQFIVVNYYR